MNKTKHKLQMYYEGAKVQPVYCLDVFHAIISAVSAYYTFKVEKQKKFMAEVYFLDQKVFEIHPTEKPEDLLVKVVDYFVELANYD